MIISQIKISIYLLAGGNAHVMSMWGEENSSPVLALHFGFAAGNILGPVLAGPFLMDTNSSYINHSYTSHLPMDYIDDLYPVNPYMDHAESFLLFDTTSSSTTESNDLQASDINAGDENHVLLQSEGFNKTADYKLSDRINAKLKPDSRLEMKKGRDSIIGFKEDYGNAYIMNRNEHGVNGDILKNDKNSLRNNPSAADFIHVIDAEQNNNSSSQSQVWIPYAISGGAGLLVAMVLLLLCFIGLPEEYKNIKSPTDPSNPNERKTLRNILSPGACTGGNVVYGLQMFTLLFFFYVTNVGKDASFLTFTLPIAIDGRIPLNFNKHSADLLMTVSAVCAAVGRFLSALLAKCMPIQVIVFIQIMVILASQIVLVLLGLQNVTAYWVGSCAFNMFSSPLFPSVLAWADKYVQMTAVAVAVVDVATGIGSFVFAWLAGYVFHYKEQGALWVLYLSLGCGITMSLLMILLQICGSCHGNRFDRVRNEEQEEEREYREDEPLFGP